MESLKTKATTRMDSVFQTGYPHPVNLFATLMITLLPLLSPFIDGRPGLKHGVAGLCALLYLLFWSRLRVYNPERSARFYQGYLFVQAAVVSLIYVLDGGLTRFLFVVVAVQAVYITPVRRWAPFLGTLAALWLTLYLVFTPGEGGGSMVATIGLYISYLVFAALVTFTTVQQERQTEVAHELLDGVDRRHHMLRAYERRIADRAEMEERERLAQTICAMLQNRLGDLAVQLARMQAGALTLNRQTARAIRLEAKEVLGAVRQSVRTLRPGEPGDEDIDEDEPPVVPPPPEPEVGPTKWTDPIRVYHFWNIGVIVVTTGVMIASTLVGGIARGLPLTYLGLGLLAAYAGSAMSKAPWSRTLFLVLQAGAMVRLVGLADEPLMNHLFIIIAAQMVFLVPPVNRWLVTSVVFPTVLSAMSLWLTGGSASQLVPLLTYTAAFAVTNFFGGVMAFMTKRQVEARDKAVMYTQQLAEVNRLLEARLQEARRMAIARERVRMAREIHDGLGHHLTIVIVGLQYAEELADEDRAAALQHIRTAARVVDRAIEASRELDATLERFDRPLPVAIRDLTAAWQKGNGAKVALRVQGDFAGLSTAARISIYRAVQESLTNIQKHANARKVDIDLQQKPDRVILTVTNDSVSPAPAEEPIAGGFGLLGLKERAEALQGEFTAEERSAGGFQVRLVLPVGGER
ncbi:MAG TPA: sensor histidine kinase [Symbiobacteriaceae bacterium]